MHGMLLHFARLLHKSVSQSYHILSGSKIAKSIKEHAHEEITSTKERHPRFSPTLKIIQVGDRPDSTTYIRMKLRAAKQSGVNCIVKKFPEEVSQMELLKQIEKANEDGSTHGLLVQVPLPRHLDESSIANAILPEKDVDGFHRFNVGELAKRKGNPLFLPCTAKGCLRLLRETGTNLAGKAAVVIGRSDIVGNPVASLLRNHDATVTVCHSHTVNTREIISRADIVVAACGIAEYVKGEWLKPGAIVIDVGINYVKDHAKSLGQRLVGDVEFASAKEHASWITPVPGGVGPMTVAMLVKNVVTAAKRQLYQSKRIPQIEPSPLQLQSLIPSNIDVPRNQLPKHITQLAQELGIHSNELEPFSHYKAKVSLSVFDRIKHRKNGKYILVTGITPTPLGENKSTTTLGLVQSLNAHYGRPSIASVCQPSMGPTFGIKDGVAGDGYSQVIPMDEFDLHLADDIYSIGTANNLLANAIDARIFHESTQKKDILFYNRLVPKKNGSRSFTPSMLKRLRKLGISKTNPDNLTPEEINKFSRLNINPSSISIERVVDVNDRMLRHITIGEARGEKGHIRTTGFDVTIASELMDILTLSNDLKDMRRRIGRMVIGYNINNEFITVEDIGYAGALTALLKDNLKPNLMQSLKGAPVMARVGPFANISIGTSSVIADKIALKLMGSDESSRNTGYVITEAGFDFSMGGERFCDIKTRSSGLIPDVIVLVATTRALKLHGGGSNIRPGEPLPREYLEENVDLVSKGCCNLLKHISNISRFGMPVVVAINSLQSDTSLELQTIQTAALRGGAFDAVITDHWKKGNSGAIDLARAVMMAADQPKKFQYLYDLHDSPEVKMESIVKNLYGGARIMLSQEAHTKLNTYKDYGLGSLPVCIAKTQYSLSHNPTLKGVPRGYTFPINDIGIRAGAGYIYALAAEMQTIPSLSTYVSYMNVEMDE